MPQAHAGLLLPLPGTAQRNAQAAKSSGLFQTIDKGIFDHPVAHPVHRQGHANLLRIFDFHIAFQSRQRGRRLPGHQKPRAHGNPGRPAGQCSGQTATGGIATGGNHRHLYRIQHLGQQNGARHPAGMPAAFTALNRDHVRAQLNRLERMLECPHRRNAQHPGLLEALNGVAIRPAPITDGTQAVLDRQVHALRRVLLEHMKVEAEITATGGLDHALDFGLQLIGSDGRPRQKPESPGTGAGDHQIGVRHPAHRGLHDGVAATQGVGQRRLQILTHRRSPAAVLFASIMALAS